MASPRRRLRLRQHSPFSKSALVCCIAMHKKCFHFFSLAFGFVAWAVGFCSSSLVSFKTFFLNFSDANFEKTRKLQMVAPTAAANWRNLNTLLPLNRPYFLAFLLCIYQASGCDKTCLQEKHCLLYITYSRLVQGRLANKVELSTVFHNFLYLLFFN